MSSTNKIGLLPLCLFALCSCGGDDGPGDGPDPTPKTTPIFSATDPCNAKLPVPNDFFRSESGASELSECPLLSEPIEAVIQDALRDNGAPIDSAVLVPMDGSISLTSMTATASFVLTNTSSAGGPLPPTLFLVREESQTSTNAEDWSIVEHSQSIASGAARLRPNDDLDRGRFYVAVITKAVTNDEPRVQALEASDATRLLVGDQEIVAGAYADLDAATAARLERQRQRLKDIVKILGESSPPIAAEDIVSIHSFSTELGYLKTTRTMDEYYAAAEQGRFPYQVTFQGGDITPAELYPGLPGSAYDSIDVFRRGTISTPQLLDDDNRIRERWNSAVQTTEVPFLLSIPRNATEYPVVLFLPGFGRSKLDIRAIANEFASNRVAVLAVDLRCFGDRSPGTNGICVTGRTTAEIANLADTEPNNANPELQGSDGIPDASSLGFFPALPRQIVATHLAAAMEVVHILETLVDQDAFRAENIGVMGRNLHMIAHGPSVHPALTALATFRGQLKTVQFPAGGLGLRAFLLDGADSVKQQWLQQLPSGIGESDAMAYLLRLEEAILPAVSPETAADTVRQRYLSSGTPRVLLNHPSADAYVTTAARQDLIDSLSLPRNRVSQHSAGCHDFFIHSCVLGVDDPTLARQQIVAFMQSDGVTVRPPGP